MIRYFITATGTDSGKTFVTAALSAAAKHGQRGVLALKPIASGFDPESCEHSDAAILLRAQGLDTSDLDTISPWRFKAPLCPDMAAAREDRTIDVGALTRFCHQAIASSTEVVLIEGVGGVMVPLDERYTVLDWMTALAIPVILVAGSYLGALSHTLTAWRVLIAAGMTIRAIVLDETAGSTVLLEDTAATLRRFVGDLPIIPVKRRTGMDPWRDVPELSPLLG